MACALVVTRALISTALFSLLYNRLGHHYYYTIFFLNLHSTEFLGFCRGVSRARYPTIPVVGLIRCAYLAFWNTRGKGRTEWQG
jgi:hypothetical protein